MLNLQSMLLQKAGLNGYEAVCRDNPSSGISGAGSTGLITIQLVECLLAQQARGNSPLLVGQHPMGKLSNL